MMDKTLFSEKMNKKEFREKLGELLELDNVVRPGLMGRPSDARMATVNRGLAEGWLCRWPDCSLTEYACGVRYGCPLIPFGPKP